MGINNLDNIFIILLNWNSSLDTIECLESIYNQSLKNFHIVIVDNNSNDNSVYNISSWTKKKSLNIDLIYYPSSGQSLIKKEFSRKLITIILNEKNSGFSEGNNIGIKYGLKNNANLFWILNNDTIVERDALSNLYTNLIKYKVDIAGSCMLYYNNKNIIQTAGMDVLCNGLKITHRLNKKNYSTINPMQVYFVDANPACSILISRHFFNIVGFFDKKYFMYHEDIDLQLRANKLGLKNIVVLNSIIWHKCGSSSKKISSLGAYYQTRNKYILLKNNSNLYILFLPILIANTLFNYLYIYQRGNNKAARAILLGFFDFFRGNRGYKKF